MTLGDSLRGFLGLRKKHHAAAVYDVRPESGDDSFEPYFIALCECDWFGDIRESPEEARRDAEAHTPHVSDEIKRPVG
jgi:hypothetical protein